MDRGNLFEDLPGELAEEQVRTLASVPGVRIERVVSTGQTSPEGFWYEQEQDEWVVVLQGGAALEIEGRDELIEMSAGDWVSIPAYERHRVAWTSTDEPTVWLAVHFNVG